MWGLQVCGHVGPAGVWTCGPVWTCGAVGTCRAYRCVDMWGRVDMWGLQAYSPSGRTERGEHGGGPEEVAEHLRDEEQGSHLAPVL